MELNQAELTTQALEALRDPSRFQWAFVIYLAFVVYLYVNEIEKRNWRAVAAGLALYSVHWFFEIANALIQHFTAHALWTAPAGSFYLILVGVGIEISMMFSVAGLILTKILPQDRSMKILGLNNRLFFAIANALLFALIEIPLAMTPVFHWTYPWWGALTVWIFVYIPFFLAANLIYDQSPRVQRLFIGAMFLLDALLFVVFALILRWI
ncbi:MAG: hypothetical protein JXR70_14245 [Spirochaetales bacterium]|nr:hypothetical protein [Spirochaetales bacterium]